MRKTALAAAFFVFMAIVGFGSAHANHIDISYPGSTTTAATGISGNNILGWYT